MSAHVLLKLFLAVRGVGLSLIRFDRYPYDDQQSNEPPHYHTRSLIRAFASHLNIL